MENATYVVHLTGRVESPFKHFRERAHARAFADGQVRISETEKVVIFKVNVTDPREAIAAVKIGEAELVDVRHSKPSNDEEIQRDTRRNWKRAVDRDPEAILEFLGLSTDTQINGTKRP